jgi:hypothetical protein
MRPQRGTRRAGSLSTVGTATGTRIILTHTNAEVRELNEAARDHMRASGDLGEDVRVTVERGERAFAPGDRVMFLRNERGLEVKNGTLGTIEQVNASSMTVRTDAGRSVSFDLKDYSSIDHGYAATIHKAQGMTVDRSHVLATPGMDRHGSYVALSRHRDGMDLHYGRDDFRSQDRLAGVLGPDRAKDMATDYELARDYAERRGITFRERVEKVVEAVRQVPEKARGIFDNFRPSRTVEPGQGPERWAEPQATPERKTDPEAEARRQRINAFKRHARTVDDVFEAQRRGGKASPEQVQELRTARNTFEKLRPHGWQDAEAAYGKDTALATEAAHGDTRRAIRALQQETGLRTDPHKRADKFVKDLNGLAQQSQQQYEMGDMSGRKLTRNAMAGMIGGLHRDPQLESVLANRKLELGLTPGMETGRSLGHDLARSLGIDMGRGLGLEL